MVKIAYAPIYCHPLPEGHRFPMLKYELIPEQLIYEGSIHESMIHAPSKMSEEDILRVHDFSYWEKLKNLALDKNEIRKTGFPLSEQLVEREAIIMQGTLDMALHALEHGCGLNVAGGTHHAYSDRGEGFCLLNDMAIAAQYLLDKNLVQRVMIIDCDVHQGNGTASIFENESRVFTFSMHGEHNYPLHKEKSDRDIPLPDKIQDAEYLNLLEKNLSEIIPLFQPQFIFYQCGVDILASDKLGRLGVSLEACKQRDQLVFSFCKKYNIPVCCAMGGGYSEDIKIIVEAHCNTFRLALEFWGE
jgi:acetoin utilization deacetylase AcuC-like enzyme